MSIRTCLIGQSTLFRAGLKMLLRNSRFEVERETETLHEILNSEWSDTLFLVGFRGDVQDIEADISSLKGAAQGCYIVLLAASMEADQLAISFAAGVDGYLLDEISPEALLESLHLVVLGEKVFPSKLALLISGGQRLTPMPAVQASDVPLSHREYEIVQQLADGMPNKVIASRLSISEATVKVHLKTILKKLGLHNRTQAAIWAVQHGVCSAPDMFMSCIDSPSADLKPAA
jgi:two-component system, NarL family, nitrate/nitrite response regulator NarL